ncbi:hypothetical protein ACSU6B_26375 [Neobacillus sp. C211]|uniref:hypothetical protein n=1 Tax=unclassified Neobacillus TaxID=2675272 RepID=UPI00397AD078
MSRISSRKKREIHLPEKPYFHEGQDDFLLVFHETAGIVAFAARHGKSGNNVIMGWSNS